MSSVQYNGMPITVFESNSGFLYSVERILQERQKCCLGFVNPELVMACDRNNYVREYYCRLSHMNVIDGTGLLWAIGISGHRPGVRLTGTEFVTQICGLLQKKKMGIYLLGASALTVAEARKKLNQRFPGIVRGHHSGYFSSEEEDSIVEAINTSGAEVLMVCTGFPRQESFLVRNISRISVILAFPNGGALDFCAGKVSRAPKIIQYLGLEWLYRLGNDLTWRRVLRQLRLLGFAFDALRKAVFK